MSADPLRRLKHRAFLARRDAGLVGSSLLSRRTGALAQQLRIARAGLDLPPLAAHRGLWAVGMVRDEADVAAETIRHLLEQGVERVLVADNLSTDGTGRILRELAAEHPQVLVARDAEPAYVQSAKMTVLADAAARASARWVIPFDADELWYGAEGTLAETLSSARAPIARAVVHNVFPSPDSEHELRVDRTPHYDDKVAFRPFPGAVVAMGNHEVSRPGRSESSLRILHRPWRSYEQFVRKARGGASALALTQLPAEKGYHWRALGALSDDELGRAWESLLQGTASQEIAWRPRGSLVPLGPRLPRLWDEVRRAL